MAILGVDSEYYMPGTVLGALHALTNVFLQQSYEELRNLNLAPVLDNSLLSILSIS